jgi:N-acetyl-anhydromuramyl-L-alanine amidase AmpD
LLQIDPNGMVINSNIKSARFVGLERGDLVATSGIIVHQTDSSTATSTLASYRNSPVGAHFLIDKDGTIYQTASAKKRTSHAGKLRSRCVAMHSCPPGQEALINRMSPTVRNRAEMKKAVPDRYPSNADSIGIEIVGRAIPPASGRGESVYETVTAAQNQSLAWLVRELASTLGIRLTEVFRHPTVSQKNVTEASTARW